MPRTVRIAPVPIPPPPEPPRVRRSVTGPLGVVLLVVAVLGALGHVLASGAGSHSWDRTATPPATVRLTAGVTYSIATTAGPGVAAGVTPLTCTYSTPGGTAANLALTDEGADTRATHTVARFTAPVSGQVAVGCTGGKVGSRPVFVDDADDAGADLAGASLVLCTIAATAGAALVLGALYARTAPRREPRVSGVTPDDGA